MQYDKSCQILLLGNSAVGKTSLISRYSNGTFKEEYINTVGLDHISKTEVINNKNILVKLWDTAGQERFKALTPSYLRKAEGVILVYDVTNSYSFDDLKSWIDSIKNKLGEEYASFPVIIIGNKIDLQDNREISNEDANKFANQNNYKYFETSAKTGEGVDEAVREIVNQILKSKDNNDEHKEESNNIKIENNKVDNKKKKGCC